MKAITIWQPWASLLATGAKQYETRSWATSYRGPIAIHAAKKDISDVLHILPRHLANKMKETIGTELKDLPTGSVIATAELVNVWSIAYYWLHREPGNEPAGGRRADPDALWPGVPVSAPAGGHPYPVGR